MSQELIDKRLRLEQLKKEKEERERLKKLKELEAMKASKKPQVASNEFVKKILSDGAPLTSSQIEEMIHGDDQQNQQPESKEAELKFSSFVIEIEIHPKPKAETYDRQLQADIEDPNLKAKQINFEDDYAAQMDANLIFGEPITKSGTVVQVGLISAGSGSGVAPSVNDAQNHGSPSKDDGTEIKQELKVLSKEESKNLMKTKEFENFINKTSKIVERALSTNIDILGSFFDDGHDENQKNLGTQKGDKITALFTFQDNEPMKRAITSIEWSPKVNFINSSNRKQVPELLMCSYSKCNEWKVDEPDGMINLYSLALRKRPEHTLVSQYEITKAIFNPFQPNIVIGATYSGYILQWDIRAKNIPIQKSCLAKNGHNHPVYSLSIVGSQNAHNIVSVSNDGKCCFWSFGMLNEPKMHFNIAQNPINAGAGAGTGENLMINTSSMDFPEDETDKFFIGSEDFNVYGCSLHPNNQQHLTQTLQSHQAPITKIHMHPGASQSEKNSDISDLLLSASMDWTVKLWYPKVKKEPLFTFESSQEYVYDVQWSTVHPSVFATCDGEGYIDIWDINRDTEAPVTRKKTGQRALNCLRWSLDGRKIATGDSEGYVSLWSIDKEISMQKSDDFIKLERLIQSHQQIKV